MIYSKDVCLLKWMKEQPDKCGIVQQLNCFQTQGAGIALRIRNEFPSMYAADVNFGKKGDKSKLGCFCVTELLPNKFGYGLYRQFTFGHGKQTLYDPMAEGLEKLRRHAISKGLTKLGMPYMMGCTLGGGNWSIVKAIVNSVFLEDPEIDLYICKYEP